MAKGKGLIYRLTMGRDDRPDFETSKLPSNRFQLFKDVFFMRLGALVKINLLVLLFAFPAIAVIVVFTMFINPMMISTLPFSGNLGIGYPQVEELNLVVSSITFANNIVMYALLAPALLIASIGLAGAFNVIKLLAWGEGVSVLSHFFIGIKKHFKQFFLCGLIFSLLITITAFNLQFFINVVSNPLPFSFPPTLLRVLGIAFCIISFVVLACMVMFATTQASTYKLSLWALIKNSFLLSLALFPQNIIILLISFIPFALLMFPFVNMIGMMLMLAISFSFIILLWTVYAHHIFDKFINDRIEGAEKNKGLHMPTQEEKEAREERRRKATNIRFVNPKKKKPVSSVEEGSEIAPLASTFNRADLQRLAEEKETVKQEIDKEYEDIERDDEDVKEEQEV
ncbi:MAG: hypothetical protein FWC80_02125 [Firmicutes bacterium]|nr:hypothetical protein [Bacillota bacterium]